MDETIPKPIALGYIRVSNEERDQKGYSVEDQKERISEYTRQKGWYLAEIYVDNGYSGGFLERPSLDELRDRVDTEKVDYAVACYRDRWSRGEDPSDMWILTETLKLAGCSLMSMDFLGDLQTPEGRFQADILDSAARYQRAKVKELTRRGKRRKAMSGRIIATTFVDYGFDLNASRDGYVVAPERMATVERIFHMVGNEGMGLSSVAKRLMADGVPAPRGGRKWYTKVLSGIVKSEVYLTRPHSEIAKLVSPEVATRLDSTKRYGIWWYGKRRHEMVAQKKFRITETDLSQRIPVPVPDCGVEPSLVLRAREAIKSRRGIQVSKEPKYELSGGLVSCALCGNRMGTSPNGWGVRYYRCNSRATFGPIGCEGAKTTKAETLEGEVWSRVKGIMTHTEFLEEALERAIEIRRREARRDPHRELSVLIKRSTEIENKRTRIEDAVLNEVMSTDRARERIKEIDEEVALISAKMKSIHEAEAEVDKFERRAEGILSWSRSEAMSNLDSLSPTQRRRLYLKLGVSVSVDAEGEVDVRWPLGAIPPWSKNGTRMDILTLHVVNPSH